MRLANLLLLIIAVTISTQTYVDKIKFVDHPSRLEILLEIL